ncbi:hypothetical protein CC86DRAFT_399460 [Ophiobolus disseminans]|uniref:Uncharacterized protein n=1 Tax=Ophiobolus disseminans TaxID=1469910 RepID=A0A6A7AJM5_9PLEO|nr:hypothetical protein CC86DRAFT_399460 [Ophiobolus disseminans]
MGKRKARTEQLERKGITADSLNSKLYRTVKKKLARSTERNYGDAKNLWQEFCDWAGTPCPLAEGAPVPESETIKRFLTWWAGSSTGKIEDNVSVTSAEVTWARYQAVIFRETGHRVPRKTNEDILAREHNLSLLKKDKGLCDIVVHEHLAAQLLCHDIDEFPWERDRVQMLFILQLHMFSGGRPSAFVPTGYYPEINLTYGDVDFLLLRDGLGVEKFAMALTQRFRKGEKEKINDNLQILWTEEEDVMNSPVHSFLAIAFADQAFEALSCRDDLQKQTLGTEQLKSFPFKEEFRNQPFLVNQDGTPVRYQRVWYNLKHLSLRAGYNDYIRPYDIRRGTANKLDESPEVSAHARNQVFGHSHRDVYKRHYQSSVSAVDIKGIVLRGKYDEGFTAIALRRKRRLQRLPSRLPSRLN